MDHDAIARLDKKTGTRVLCGRRNTDGGQSCRGQIGTLVIERDGVPVVQLEPRNSPHRTWHEGEDGILRQTRRREPLRLRRVGGLANLAVRWVVTKPKRCLCPRCEEPLTVNLVDPAALLAEFHARSSATLED